MRSYILAALVLTLVVAGCSGSGGSVTSTTTASAPGTSETPATTTSTTLGDDDGPGTTATTRPPTTRTPASTTTTTTTRPPRTTTSTSTTTTTRPALTAPPTVAITRPADLSRHQASFDDSRNGFGALVTMSARATDPDGDPVTIRWSSSVDGPLGTGATITAWLSTVRDTSQPVITATATDPSGARGTASIQVIVWIPSDN